MPHPAPLPAGLPSANAMPSRATDGANRQFHRLRRAAAHVRGPALRMLHSTIVRQIGLGAYMEAAAIAVLLMCNAASGCIRVARDALMARPRSTLAVPLADHMTPTGEPRPAEASAAPIRLLPIL